MYLLGDRISRYSDKAVSKEHISDEVVLPFLSRQMIAFGFPGNHKISHTFIIGVSVDHTSPLCYPLGFQEIGKIIVFFLPLLS